MFKIEEAEPGRFCLIGRLDATQAGVLREALDDLTGSCSLDFAKLDYISSAALGVLLGVQKRLEAHDAALRISKPTPHVRELLVLARFDLVFEID